jgi:hypothetical protein
MASGKNKQLIFRRIGKYVKLLQDNEIPVGKV